ncbi:uncharacterized protein BDZ99DRAFT_375148 [Mytilinidion resinicola]|uniref:Uncharacterized protein n=1 Tax=Mytilinidion resinicola TaxID=574789 RepID=A0A6A6ZA65_9PEZI|nr:uncharacterized protein BDZ99DRAFT_375148 [Mytilinidion resinicola]KAF2817097.1 hypothetical protein BDZ99DRAFT_375148 [Mytilinidion resinicola]
MFSRTITSLRPLARAPRNLSLRGRALSTLPNNPHIYVFPSPGDPKSSILSLLPTDPPTQSLAIGTTTSIPPTPASFTENHQFLGILQSVFHSYATQDPEVQYQAAAFASPGGFNLGGNSGEGAGGASQQGGMGGANRGGWIHVSDTRNPPDWGRIAWPEDIFGSAEVDGDGKFADGGSYQASGTYRVVTREGILGLSTFLREKLVERLRDLEKQSKNN